MSDQAVSFDCPSCGGPLDVNDAVNNLVTCPFCGKNVIVPEALRKPVRPPAPQQVVIQLGETHAQVEQGIPYQVPVVPRRRRQNSLSCLVWLIILFVIITVVGSTAAPIIATGVITNQIKGMIPDFKGVETKVSQSKPADVASTVEAALTQQVGPILAQLTTTAPSFYTVDLQFGQKGSGPGMFEDTRWIAVAPDGSIFTADYTGGRIQKFGADGKYIGLSQTKARLPLKDIAINRKGVLYYTTQGEIQKLDTDTGEALGKLAYAKQHSFSSLAVTPDGGLAAISNGENVVIFDAAGKVTLEIPKAISTITDQSELEGRVAVDGLGNIYILGSFNPGVFVYSSAGKYLNRIGSKGNEPDQLQAVNDVAVDGSRRVYISDIKGVLVFSNDGRYLGTIDVSGAPFGLALDDQDHLHVMTNKPLVYKITIR